MEVEMLQIRQTDSLTISKIANRDIVQIRTGHHHSIWIFKIDISPWMVRMEMFSHLINPALELCFISYNSRGFGNEKQDFCRYLVSQQFVGNKTPVLCNQENFVLKGNFRRILQSMPGFHFIIKPAVKETNNKGRARNGMFIAVPDSIKNQIYDVSPVSWRIQAAILKCVNSNLLIINSYFPVDSRNDGGDVIEVLEAIKQVIEQNEFTNILWLGDINCDFMRTTFHTNQVNNFIEENHLKKSWSQFDVDFTMYHEINDQTIISTIDHFFWNEGLESKICDAGVFHSPDNLSDHCPIYCVLKDGNDDIVYTEDFHSNGIKKPSWKKASSHERESFQSNLDNKLNNIIIPQSVLECQDVHCNDPTHYQDVDNLTISILETVETSAFENLPVPKQQSKSTKKKPIPGWSDHVHPFVANSQGCKNIGTTAPC